MKGNPHARPAWLRPWLRWLDRRGRGKKLFRLCLPPERKHLAVCGPRFHLLGDTPDLARRICFDGQELGQTQPASALRDSRSGDLFVLGTGPSVKELDLAKLAGHDVFGVNGAMALCREFGLKPSHYAVTDPDFFEHRLDLIREIMASGCDCFFSAAGLRAIAEREPSLLAHARLFLTEIVNRSYHRPRLGQAEFLAWARAEPDLVLPEPVREDDSRVGWSWDLAKGIFCSRTILFRALQIAAFLGYRRLFVLGMDLGFRGDQPRAYAEGPNARPSKLERDFQPFILPAFEVLGRLVRAEKIEIYNLSAQSRLPESIIPRMTFEEALGRK